MKTNHHLRLSAMGAAALLAAIALPAAATNPGGGLSAYEPGLFYGSISKSGISSDAPAGTNHVLGAEMVYKAPWGSYITYAYWGEIYLDGSDYRFSSRIDDAFSLSIAGQTITGGASVKYLNLTGLAAGWYPFEYRVYNGTGGYGGWAGYVKNNLTATHTSASYTTFSKLLDPGDMSLFRCRYTEKDRMLVLSGIDQEIGFVDPPYGATGNLAAGQTIVCTASNLAAGQTIVCTASNLVADAAGYAGVCTGHVVYAKSGDVRTVLTRGPETTFTYTHPGCETELVWLWETNLYTRVKATALTGGSFEFPGITANDLYPLGASLTLTAVPAEGYSFIRWKGVDASLASSPQITVEVTAPAVYTAIFGNPLPPVFVKADATGDADGTTWRDAFKTIGAGVAAAIAQGGGEVRVAGGVYPVTAAISITGANAVSVRGGYPGLDEGETDADRDPDLHQVVITADTGTQASTWNHFAPSADGMTYVATNTPLKIVENGRVNLPDAHLAGEYDSFYPKRANNNTASAFNASGAAPFLLDGVWFVARGPVFTVATTCTSFIARDCRIVGCNGMVYTTSAAQTATYPRRFENCQFLHLSGQHVKPKGIAEFDNCIFRGNINTADWGPGACAFYLWAGGPTYYRGCEFSRHSRFVAASGDTSARAGNGNVFADEQSSGGVFSGCVFTNNLTSAKNAIGATLLGVNSARFERCLFENN